MTNNACNDDVKEWLSKQQIKIGEKTEEGITLMHIAASEGRVDVMEWLKNQGADINAKDVEYCTPSYYAIMNCNTEAAKWLKAQGAIISNKDTSKLSLWDYFCYCLGSCKTFRGRARRSEFWGFFLFAKLFYIPVIFFDIAISL